MRFRNLLGQTFGQWTVLKHLGRNQWGEHRWKCRCSCGTKRSVIGTSLMKGASISCGCTAKDWCRKHGLEATAIYNAWASMIQRCENTNARSYPRYGGRGITVCGEWRKSFEAFYRDMGPKPAGRSSVGRIDNDGNYIPHNCRWETVNQQARNRSNNHLVTFRGEALPISEWSEHMGISRKIVFNRIAAGWTVEAALTTPKGTVNRWTGRPSC